MRVLLFLGLLLLPFPGQPWCGDYTLTISNDPNAACTGQARRIQEWCAEEKAKGNECFADQSWPIRTTDEVVDSLNLYFSGKEPTIKILVGAFSNGHLSFCTAKEKYKIYYALKKIRASGKASNKRHLEDFIGILRVKER